MNALSLFSGIGGIDLAFEREGIHVEAQCEIDERCRKLLAARFPGKACYEDVRDLDGRDFRGIDIVAGGFPCQDVSVAGRREGLVGDRSKLWWEFHRVLDESKAGWVFIENVPGLLTSNRGRDMGAILGSLGELGYGFAYRVLDAQAFGIPQRRRRVFIVGHLGDGKRPAEILLEPESGGGDPGPRQPKGQIASALTASGLGGGGPDDNLAQANHLIPTVTGTLTARTKAGGFPGSDDSLSGFVIPYVNALTARCGSTFDSQQAKQLLPFRKMRRPTADENDPETWEDADHTNTLDAGGNVTRTAHAVVYSVYPERGQGADLAAREVDVAPALSATDSKLHDRGARVVSDWGVRRLMPIECERLMGFPDGYTAGFADTHRYKMLGNSVAVPVVQWIARRMMNL